jgi:hypothetical protein
MFVHLWLYGESVEQKMQGDLANNEKQNRMLHPSHKVKASFFRSTGHVKILWELLKVLNA